MIGLDISDKSVKIVRLSNDGRRKLLSACWQEIPDQAMEQGLINNQDLVKQAVQQALIKCNLNSFTQDAVVASIPEAESFMRVVEMPPMDDSELTEAVRWEVAQHIPFGIDNVFLDWQLVKKSTSEHRQEVLVGAAEKKLVSSLESLLLDIGLDVAALELESQAIVRSLVSPDLRDKQGLLIIDLGSSATNVVIHDRGTIRFTATLRKGADNLLGVLPADIRAKLTGPPDKKLAIDNTAIVSRLRPVLDELLTEIHSIVEFYTRLDNGREVNEIILTGGGANLAGLDNSFMRFFGDVHTQRGNPWVNILTHSRDVVPPMSLDESVHFATALGLALRPDYL